MSSDKVGRLIEKLKLAILALENLLNSEIVQNNQFYGHAEAIHYAQRILEDLRSEDL